MTPCEEAFRLILPNWTPLPVPGQNIAPAERNRYAPNIRMGCPLALSPVGGQTVLLVKQSSSRHVVVWLSEVKVTVRSVGMSPLPMCWMRVATSEMRAEQALGGRVQSEPLTTAKRVPSLTAFDTVP